MFKRVTASLTFLVLLAIGISYGIKEPETENKSDAAAIPVSLDQGPEVGSKAPDFELPTLDGQMIRLSDLKGKKIMVNFWTTWCPPCKAEMPDMQKFYTEEGNQIKILAVNIDTDYDVAGFVKEMKINFPILLDNDEKVMKQYRILTIPTTFFIDESGTIQNKFIGAMSIDKMRELTQEL
ncbi:TlpA disulfide reductase family protein [Robertmurraya sp. DFI.2.37]|uniref:peroxiredoxin family protein n=1 Tax=Robertmurraya sp. DFI.2.37 TaxID=3031819 RepID=UPI001244F8A6|nr:TlpA disulfide reductase family protein [Robertmurraya sp. DFI.2.37]MDF1511411.1 TlpA disulfide reductase family protein [Robertmurraya sp. DFI.2.37]